MHYRQLGASALRVSPLCLGTMLFGEATPDAEAARIVARARERGVNFIDTADVYNGGLSEEVTGRLIAADRDEWVLATKLGNRMGPGPNAAGFSRKWVMQAVEGSLRRLGTGHVDILYLHRIAYGEPLEEPLRAIGDLIREGKLRYFGVSNFHGWRIVEVCRICDALGMARPVVSQPLYNAVSRGAEVEQLPAAAHCGLGVVSYSPLARGVLTGQYRPGADPAPGTRAARGDVRMHQTEWRAESLEIAQRIAAHARARGIAAGQFALAWVLANRLVTAAVAGPRTLAQWEGYLSALDYELSAEDEALVDGLVAPGHASTPGYNDPAYPIEGRRPRSAG
jgi:aryl-alcohol dehydrogenase-like predicted oxidoreductase